MKDLENPLPLLAPHERQIPAPTLPYRPLNPVNYRPAIGLIGCGGITKHHLEPYRASGYNVVALCDVNLANAELRREEFYPEAEVYRDYRDVLKRDDIEVVDVATHPAVRVAIIEEALKARKHVLSQKPFVLDLDAGERLVELAARMNVKLAVNQNGRWAPHFSYARAAVAEGILGDVMGVHMSVHWDHSWVAGTEFERIRHLILYDYAIHWFDMLTCLLPGKTPRRVYASNAKTKTQTIMPPLLGQALIEYDDAQATLAFDANTPLGSQDRTYVAGTRGSLSSVGPGNKVQSLTIYTPEGYGQAELVGSWFSDGFHGTMGELLRAIEENREPTINARDNLTSLAVCFAAAASADRHEPIVPGDVRVLPS